MGNRIEELEQRIASIEMRNTGVEGDKDWEVSWLRRGLLVTFTYLAVGVYLWVIDISHPWLNAIVPAGAFMLSTLTLPIFKDWWLSRRNKK